MQIPGVVNKGLVVLIDEYQLGVGQSFMGIIRRNLKAR